jgi:hypothetical protein
MRSMPGPTRSIAAAYRWDSADAMRCSVRRDF